MIRDQGPSYNLGFGITGRDLPQGGDNERRGADPRSGVLAKYFQDKPIAKFLAVSAATLITMHVAGEGLRKGGIKLMAKGVESEVPEISHFFSFVRNDIRGITKTLDDWEGATRAVDGTYIPHDVFYFTKKEKDAMSAGKVTSAEVTFRQVMQQRLARQARRLPYELPAMYMAQRAPGIGTDDLFGADSRDKPNWYNPADVIADFGKQSVKNLAGLLLPIEAGGGAAKLGWQRLLQNADSASSSQFGNKLVNLGYSLKLVGHSASDVLADMVRVSNKGSAAISAGIHEAVSKSRSPVEVLRELGLSPTAKTRRAWVRAMSDLSTDNPAMDLFSPIGGMARFSAGAKGKWTSIEDEMRHMDALHAGLSRVRLKSGAVVDVDPRIAQRSAGGSFVEAIAASIMRYGGKNAADLRASDPSFRRSEFYNLKMTDSYKDVLAEHLRKRTDLSTKDIDTFVRLLDVHNRPSMRRGEFPLSGRLGFGNVLSGGANDEEFVRNLGEGFGFLKHGKAISKALTEPLGTRGRLIDQVDEQFRLRMASFEADAHEQWQALYQQGFVPGVRSRLGQRKAAAAPFDNLGNPDVLDFLVRNTAHQINKLQGHQLIDPEHRISLSAGKTVMRNARRSMRDIAVDLEGYGFSLRDPEGMKAFLQQQKVISHSREGFNFFGMRRLSVEDALNRGLFRRDLTGTIRSLSNRMAASDPLNTADWLRSTNAGDIRETTYHQMRC